MFCAEDHVVAVNGDWGQVGRADEVDEVDEAEDCWGADGVNVGEGRGG